ncbi:MAG TPA: PEP-CTERM sorting domain-containing protein [Terriglobales bacterium]|nr:PEP-CTERM sorting domain-containing protein [Terriglobales bacterium]
MKRILHVIGTLLLLATPLFAGTITFDLLSGNNVVLGTSQPYTVDGITITAYGFKSSATSLSSPDSTAGTAVDLFSKNGGASETGLGIASAASGDSDNEIVCNSTGCFYIQLDLTNLILAGGTNQTTIIESVQAGETFNLWAGKSANGALGSLLSPSGTCLSAVCTETVKLSLKTPILGLSAPNTYAGGHDVLLSSMSATVPEPGSLVLLGSGLCIVGGLLRRRLGKRDALN